MKNLNKKTKKELIELIKKEEFRPVVNNSLINSSVSVQIDDSDEDTEVLLNVSEALKNITNIIKNKKNRPIYGIKMGSGGIEENEQ
jgi:hypothetical protein